MEAIAIMAAINASLKLAKTLMPEIDRLYQAGQITAEQQRESRDIYESLKTQADGQFSGPHWQIDPNDGTD